MGTAPSGAATIPETSPSIGGKATSGRVEGSAVDAKPRPSYLGKAGSGGLSCGVWQGGMQSVVSKGVDPRFSHLPLLDCWPQAADSSFPIPLSVETSWQRTPGCLPPRLLKKDRQITPLVMG